MNACKSIWMDKITDNLIKEKIAYSSKKGLFAVFLANKRVRDG